MRKRKVVIGTVEKKAQDLVTDVRYKGRNMKDRFVAFETRRRKVRR